MSDIEISEKILQAIKYGIQSSLKTISVDKTHTGTIVEVLGSNQFLVKYDDAVRKIITKNSPILLKGETVHICYPLNNSEKKYMIEDVPSGSGGGTVTGVSSVDGLTGTVTLINKYASKSSEHTHTNKSVLDKLSDSDGVLLYNGSEISGGSGSGINDSFMLDFGSFTDTESNTVFDCGCFS